MSDQLVAVAMLPSSTAATIRALGRARANGTLDEIDGKLTINGAPVVRSLFSMRAIEAAVARRVRRTLRR